MMSKQAELQKDLDIIKGNEEGARGPNAARMQMKAKRAKKKSMGDDADADSGAEKASLASSIRKKIAKKRRRTDSSSSSRSSDKNKSLGKIKLPGGRSSNGTETQSVKNTKKPGPRSRGSIDPNAVPVEAIQFTIGWRIEAVDHGQWYKAKIVEVDKNKGEILVHFDGWGAKFDTWYPMTSALIRGRTEVKKKEDDIVFTEGEDVLARWTDGNFYPATVMTVKESGSCVVMYFDGMKKLIRPNLMKKMSEKAKEIATEAANKLLLHPIDIPIGTSPRSDDNGKPNYRTSANDRERRVAARRGRLSDTGSIDSSPVKSTTSTPIPKPAAVTPASKTLSSATPSQSKKRGRPRRSTAEEVPEKVIKTDVEPTAKITPVIPTSTPNQKTTSSVSKQDSDIKQNGKNRLSGSPEKDKNLTTESSTEEERDFKTSRLDNIISKIGPDGNKKEEEAEMQKAKSEFVKGNEVLVSNESGGNMIRCLVLQVLKNNEFKVQLKKDGTERIVKSDQMKLSYIPPLKIPLSSSAKKDESIVKERLKDLGKESVSGSDSDARPARSSKTQYYGSRKRHSGVNYSREELVSVKWEGLWYQATVINKVNQDNYRLKFDSGMEKIFNENFIRPWKKRLLVEPVKEAVEEMKKPAKPFPSKNVAKPIVVKPKGVTTTEEQPEPEQKKTDLETEKGDKTVKGEDGNETKKTESKPEQSNKNKMLNELLDNKLDHSPDPSTEPVPTKNTVARPLAKSTIPPKQSAPKLLKKSSATPPRKPTITPSRHASNADEKKIADQAAQNIQVGDVVLARWADCKNYPATVLQIKKDGDYVVRYYDGYTKSVSPRLIKQWAPKQMGNTASANSSPKLKTPSQSTPVTPPKQTDHHKYRCRAPECNKSFRKESLLLQHHKHYHHQRYKFRDETTLPNKRRPSKETGSGTPKRRVSADYEALMKYESPQNSSSEISVTPIPEVMVPADPPTRSRGGKPPMNIYKKHTNDGSFSMDEDFTASIIPDTTPEVSDNTVESDTSPAPKKSKWSNVEDDFTDHGETTNEEVVVNEDVIRCSCLDDNEVGVMIQCEGCLTWQHMSCAEHDKTFKEVERKEEVAEEKSAMLTPGYYCYVCRNPTKNRNAHEVLNQNEFLLTGAIRHILNVEDSNIPNTTKQLLLLAINDLMTELSHVHDVLLGVKSKLRIAADTNHPNLCLWKDPVKSVVGTIKDSDDIDAEKDTGATPNKKATPVENGEIEEKLNNTPSKNKKNGKEVKVESSEEFKFQCRDNLLDHIIDVEKSLVDRLTQLDGYIDVLQPRLEAENNLDDVEIAKNLLQVERDLTATHQLLKLTQ